MPIRPFITAFLVFGAFLSISFGAFWGTVSVILAQNPTTDRAVYFYIAPGSGLLRTAYIGERDHIVRARWHFLLAASLLDLETIIRAGEYEIKPEDSLFETLDRITHGRSYKRRVTIPEGLSNIEIVELLENTFGLNTENLALPEEGSLMPDTYFYERGDSAEKIVAAMRAEMQKTLDKAWANRAENLPYATKRDALILASIIEKETGQAGERDLVASVFVNRLRRGMRLQSDPTVIYGISAGRALGRGLLRSELDTVTPYNTYKIKGLPPTPIANPGRASISAALNPAHSEHLYFVADGSGGHAFAATLKDHQKNVAVWRKIEREAQIQE